MARIGSKEQAALKKILSKVDGLIEHVEELLEEACIEAPSPAEFRRNPDSTFQNILEVQQVLTKVSNTHTRVQIEDSRLWAFNEDLKSEFGVVETEAITKRVRFYIKRLKDLSAMLNNRKSDLTQIITSVRSVQSAYTNRFKVTAGN